MTLAMVRLSLALAIGCGLSPDAAAAISSEQETVVAPVVVIASSPLPGADMAIAKIPYDVQTLTGADVRLSGAATSGGALEQRLGSVSLNDNLDSPFQPDILYRGFEASPVLGTPQGLAVYQNGVRINEAFGDAVNWDLIPDFAVARIDIVGANPVYGLNALGGAVVVSMKTGFDTSERQIEAQTGAFGRRSASLTLAGHDGSLAGLLAVKWLGDDGWRFRSASEVRQIYADVSWRNDRADLDVSYSGADNALRGESAAPIQELEINRRLVFTSPQRNANRLSFLTVNGSYAATKDLNVQGAIYHRAFHQSDDNGDTTSFAACAGTDLSGRLCQSDGTTPLTDVGGRTVPDFSDGGNQPIGENDREWIRAASWGATVQASSRSPVLGRSNQATVGLSVDVSTVDFVSAVEVGVIDASLMVQPSGYVISTPEGLPFDATPIRLRSNVLGGGLYLTDTWDVTRRLSVTASERYNRVRIALRDRSGPALDGTSVYARLNPALGLTYKVSSRFSAYLGYSEGSRTPTPSEIECADPTRPCLLPSSLSADPPVLKAVVSHTVEAGLRGGQSFAGGRLNYSAGLYRTAVHDDIYAVATSLNAGYFTNIKGTLRQGGDANLTFSSGRLMVYASFAHVDATFDTGVVLPSPSNPARNASDDIVVRRGAHLPNIPTNRFKAGFDQELDHRFRIGADLKTSDAQWYRGDEANALRPLSGYFVVGVHGAWRATPGLEVSGRIENVFNKRFATFGVLGDPTGVNAPGVPATGVADPRFISPAAPISAYVGVRATF